MVVRSLAKNLPWARNGNSQKTIAAFAESQVQRWHHRLARRRIHQRVPRLIRRRIRRLMRRRIRQRQGEARVWTRHISTTGLALAVATTLSCGVKTVVPSLAKKL